MNEQFLDGGRSQRLTEKLTREEDTVYGWTINGDTIFGRKGR